MVLFIVAACDPVVCPIHDPQGNTTTDVCDRKFGAGHFIRPCFVQLFGSRNLLIEDVTIIDSPART